MLSQHVSITFQIRIVSELRFKTLKQAGIIQDFAGLHVSAFKGFVTGSNLTAGKGKIGEQMWGKLKQR